MKSRMTTTAFKARKMNLLDRMKEMDKNKTMFRSRKMDRMQEMDENKTMCKAR